MGVLNYTQAGRAALVVPSNTENIPNIAGGTNSEGYTLYTGSGGAIKVMTIGGDIVTFVDTQPGQILQVKVLRVYADVTDATDILALS